MMWLIPTKKEVKRELKKIESSFKLRDLKLAETNKTIETLKEKIETNALKIATLEGAYSVLYNKSQASQMSQSQASLKAVSKQSLPQLETRLIQRIRKNKKSIVMAEIMKLLPSYSVVEIFDRIVLERKLCSKASFYRYVSSLKSQSLLNTETKQRLN